VQRVRPAAVAGSFYPSDPGELRSLVDALLGGVEPRAAAPAPKAIVVPHAGYVYSGAVAASAFACVRDRAYRRVVLLGPAHRVAVRGLALPEARSFRTPLGEVAVDEELARAARAAGAVEIDEAHAREHSLEVELPFLLRSLASVTLLPLAVGRATEEEVARVLESVWGGPDTLIVVSTDLSHYLPQAVAKRVDEETARAIERLEAVSTERACGAHGLNGLLAVARTRRMRVERLDLRTSGDTAGGRAEVVGYGAFALFEEAAR
jgi:AmmeMemoRadiSam system protein B